MASGTSCRIFGRRRPAGGSRCPTAYPVAVPADVVMYGTSFCGYCIRAKILLEKKRAAFREVDVSGNREMRSWLREATGRRTVPQIFINGRTIGGFHDLVDLERRGELDRMLSEEPPPERANLSRIG
jgi:glutaredoxin 3